MLGKLGSIALRSLKVVPKLLFGTNSDAVGGAIRAAVKKTKGGSIFTELKAAGKAGLHELEKGPKGTAFLKAVGKDIWGLPTFLKAAAKSGYKAAKAAGKSGIWGGVKGFFKGAAKKMPLIGSLLMIGCELPNIFRAGSDKGVGDALLESGKAAARLTGGAAGAAIGSAICPGIGSFVGWIAGEWLTGLVTGKTYTEKKEEAVAQFQQLGLNEQEIQYCIENDYTPEAVQNMLLQQQQGIQTNPIATQQQVQQPAANQQSVQNPATSMQYPAYSMPGLTNPFSGLTAYNPNGIGNSYSNDMFYQQLFGSDSDFLNQTSYTNPYMMYPQQTFQYTV